MDYTLRVINEQCGGSVRLDAEIETALERGKGRSAPRKIALLWRAILLGHPFTDGNKRTALTVALVICEASRIPLTEKATDRLVEEIKRIAAEHIDDIVRIERLIRYAVSQN